jgi:hypothetical protein
MPGLLKISAVSVPAKPKRKGINPFTKEEQWFAAKPATTKIKIRPLKREQALQLPASQPRYPGTTFGSWEKPAGPVGRGLVGAASAAKLLLCCSASRPSCKTSRPTCPVM